METYKCPICGNTDIHSIGYLNGKPYCRRCISFRGEEVEHKPSYPKKAPIHLEYELSPEQKELSDKLVDNYKKGIDSLVYAVCGSGKTEIVMKVISFNIGKGKKVGFAVPRKDVVIELKERFRNVFKNNVVTAVYGGHTSKVEGDLVCLTTHQLFRYENYFDLLILDETDAFPFNRNAILEAICKRAIKGYLILMSATSKEQDVRKLFKHNYMKLELYTRFHGHPLPVPQIRKQNSALMMIELIKEIKRFIRNGKQTFIFVPTIKICEKTYSFLKIFIKEGECVHSQKTNRNEIIQRFRGGKTKYLVTTAVLERGVTIKDVQVIVFHAENNIYDESALVQISGRVGRKIDAPDGEVLFLATQITKGMTESIKIIKRANEKLFEDKGIDMIRIKKEEPQFCKVCFSKIRRRSFYTFVNEKIFLCDRCMSKISAKFHYFKVGKYSGMAIFDYDAELKKLIYQFKGCFDIELKQIFLERYAKEIAVMYKGYIVVPAPSYEEENKIREFNHVNEIFKQINLEMEPCIEKTTRFKQAEHKSSGRSEIGKHLKLVDGTELENKKVLLVDDVYTTGSTIKAMISLIEPLKPKKIKILVISKTVLKPIDT